MMMMMMMSINSPGQLQQQLGVMQSNTNQVRYEQGVKNRGNSNMDRDSFMQLMLAQLQNQNPIEPVDSTQQLMQQAQFTQVEELQKLNASLGKTAQLNQALLYVGKQVDYKPEGAATATKGTVESVEFGANGIGLSIGGKTVTPEQITKLYSGSAG
jgi:flagellar basal-body rod modification protein FlgD